MSVVAPEESLPRWLDLRGGSWPEREATTRSWIGSDHGRRCLRITAILHAVSARPAIGDEQVDHPLLVQPSFPGGTGIVQTERWLPERP